MGLIQTTVSREVHREIPPSIITTAPVVHADSSDARNTTRAATSSGVPTRPRGWYPDICSRKLRT
jgi:hypothetical protein